MGTECLNTRFPGYLAMCEIQREAKKIYDSLSVAFQRDAVIKLANSYVSHALNCVWNLSKLNLQLNSTLNIQYIDLFCNFIIKRNSWIVFQYVVFVQVIGSILGLSNKSVRKKRPSLSIWSVNYLILVSFTPRWSLFSWCRRKCFDDGAKGWSL